MKKIIITLVILIMTMCTTVHAQNFLQMNITEIDTTSLVFCDGEFDSIVIKKQQTCTTNPYWSISDINGGTIFEGYTSQVTITQENGNFFNIFYDGCNYTKGFDITFFDFGEVEEPWTEDYVWKNNGDSITLYAGWENVNNEWSTGSNNYQITVIEPILYWVRMFNQCGELWDTINVHDNGDIAMATVDPQTDHIIATWEVDPLLAQDLESLIIIRDGYEIATVPYIQGQYIDEAVSGSATSRTYRCKAIAKDGSVCDFNSSPKPSIHMVYTVGYFGTVEMQFNDVSTNYADLYQYYISQWNAGEITHVDSIMPNKLRNGESVKTALGYVTMRDGVINYSAPESYFSDGYLIVEADLNGNRGRDTDKFLSNRSESTVSIEAFETIKCSVFPNPATHQFTVIGLETGTLTLYNQLGQVILTQEISGETTIKVEDLIPDIYFARISTPIGVCTKPVVVE